MTAEQLVPVEANLGQPGDTLRKAREGRSMALNDVAVALNLSPVALKNLESGAFDRLPGHTFARGYIRAYAKLLGMDQELLVREFDQVTGTNATGSSVNSVGRIEESARGSQGLLRLVRLAVLALLMLVGFLWWQDRSSVDENIVSPIGIEQIEIESANGTTQIHPLEPEDLAVESAKVEVVVVTSEQSTEVAGAQALLTDSAVSLSVAVSPAAVTPLEPTVPLVATNGEAPVSAALNPASPVPANTSVAETANQVVVADGEGLLSIRFTSNCWIQVSDADGKVLLSALKRPGEDVDVAVKLPLELRLGYASGAQVTFNGKTVDTQPFTTGETARLKLGQ